MPHETVDTPRRDPGQTPAKLVVNTTRAEKTRLIAAAESAGMKLEAWALRALREAAARGPGR